MRGKKRLWFVLRIRFRNRLWVRIWVEDKVKVRIMAGVWVRI